MDFAINNSGKYYIIRERIDCEESKILKTCLDLDEANWVAFTLWNHLSSKEQDIYHVFVVCQPDQSSYEENWFVDEEAEYQENTDWLEKLSLFDSENWFT